MLFDAKSSGGAFPGNSITYSHTCTGIDLVLHVFVVRNGSSSDETMSATYNGVSMTPIGEVASSSSRMWAFELINPETGAHNVVVSCGASDYHRSSSISHTGANQTGQPDNTATDGSTGESHTTSLTTVADNCWNLCAVASSSGNAFTASTGVNSVRDNSLAPYLYTGDSNAALTPAGSYSMVWTCTSQEGCMIQVSIAPSATSASASVSPSSSASPSISPSFSVSPSGSVSSSSSPSISPSASYSPSTSISQSGSVSPSSSASSSISPSGSVSPSSSASPSFSPSGSPSIGYSDFSREQSSSLPATDADLGTLYTEAEEIKVSSENHVLVAQDGAGNYMIHQFKKYVGSAEACKITTVFQSSLSPTSSPVYLQIYNRATTAWETIDFDVTETYDTNFELTAEIRDLTQYKGSINVVSCRVYQYSNP